MVPLGDKTILVVDDEPDIVTYLKTLLDDAGFNVMTAGDGEEALEKVEKRKPDLISLDLVMPKKSGIRFFYELRRNKEWSKIPVIIVTGHAGDDKVKREMDNLFAEKTISGPKTYLEKPVKPRDYVDLVKRELGVEVEEETKDNAKAGDELRDEAKKLLESADKETLKAALKLLREKKL